jgi:Protein of unknown function (DUF3224)
MASNAFPVLQRIPPERFRFRVLRAGGQLGPDPGGPLSGRCGTVAGMSTAKGTFDIDRFDAQDPYEDRDGVRLARAHITKTFHGDLAGGSETDIMTVHTENPAAYVGIERFDGTLHGRKGGFVLQHEAGGTDGVPWMTWKIVETSGTGELAGIRGEGQIIIGPDGGHSYTLEYGL